MTDDDLLRTGQLKDRGWTDTAIKRFLGKPDDTRANPYYRSAAPQKLWRRSRVEAAEQTGAFAKWKKGAEKRKRTAQAAVVTRITNMVHRMEQAEITIERAGTPSSRSIRWP